MALKKTTFVAERDMRRAGVHEPRRGGRFTSETATDEQGGTRATELRAEGAETAARQVFTPIRQ
jgi:hypothetical protein